MSSDRDKLIAEALRMADFHDRFGKKNETAILLRALVAELVRDTPEETEWEYGNQSISGEIVAATSERWARKHFDSAGVPIFRRQVSPGPWSPFTPTSKENE